MTGDPARAAQGVAGDERLARVEAVVTPIRAIDGWATVEIERAVLAVAGASGETNAADDPLLGARCRRVSLEDGGEIVLLEPITEGRLAASLARYGEGLAARYLVAEPGAFDRLRLAGWMLSAETDGPFGPERLVLEGPRWGPHLLVVDSPPTPPATGYHPDA